MIIKIKNFIEEGEKEFEDFWYKIIDKTDSNNQTRDRVKQFISSRQISLIKMIVDGTREKINRKFNGYGGTLGFTKTELIDLLKLTDGK